MRKNIIAALLTIAMGAFGQTAETILDKASSAMNTPKGLSANFSITMDNGKTFAGELSIKGEKMRLLTAEARMWFDGKTLWTYITKSGEVNVTNPDDKLVARLNPAKLLSRYKSGYTSAMTTGSGTYIVTLRATSASNDIQEMELTIDKTTYRLAKVDFRMAKGWNTATITAYNEAALADAIFTFNKAEYPDAEVIDLR